MCGGSRGGEWKRRGEIGCSRRGYSLGSPGVNLQPKQADSVQQTLIRLMNAAAVAETQSQKDTTTPRSSPTIEKEEEGGPTESETRCDSPVSLLCSSPPLPSNYVQSVVIPNQGTAASDRSGEADSCFSEKRCVGAVAEMLNVSHPSSPLSNSGCGLPSSLLPSSNLPFPFDIVQFPHSRSSTLPPPCNCSACSIQSDDAEVDAQTALNKRNSSALALLSEGDIEEDAPPLAEDFGFRLGSGGLDGEREGHPATIDSYAAP
eukprot:Cvel_28935.t1-p1 / transcript=Cvel_28935.t1 / gene=Cvel_28935 / organism=Chromera_velia_CCMP2878 / gene_product=hypothetical protein / transcript_product=hypothetical protein / location=Cvel_scaffold3877:1499-5590(-) / protein_length=260 / sequence_SO=supercontig / SO=protein_coding / is_pseudo=false